MSGSSTGRARGTIALAAGGTGGHLFPAEALARELQARGLRVQRQVPVPIVWKGQVFDEGFRADLIVEDKVIVELKSVERWAPVHAKQLLTYLRLTDRRLGLLVNFGEALIKDGIRRVVNGLQEDSSRQDAEAQRRTP